MDKSLSKPAKKKLAGRCSLGMSYFAVLILGLTIAGCSSIAGMVPDRGQNIPSRQAEIITPNYAAGTSLINIMAGRVPEDTRFLLTSFVNLDNLSETSTLGRIIPHQIGTRLTQCGYEVVDMRLRTESLLVREKEGEFALSRKLTELARDNKANAILVGTYSVVYNQVYVHTKVLRTADSLTLAAADYMLPYDLRALNPAGFSGADITLHHFTPNISTGNIN